MHHRPRPRDAPSGQSASSPPGPSAPAAVSPPGSGAFMDTFLARTLANSVSMVAVAAGVLWLVGQQDAEHDAALDELRDEVALLRLERDRMQSVAGELAREVHDAGMESEIVRWQLAYTEERLRKAERAWEAAEGHPPVVAAPGYPTPAKARAAVFRATVFEPLDAPARAVVGLSGDGAALPIEARVAVDLEPPAGTAGPEVQGGGTAEGGARLLALDDFDPQIPRVAEGYSQLDRDRAYGAWAGIVHDAIQSECGRRITETGQHRCARELRRTLRPYATRAVECIVSGNARPDYFSELDPDRVPSHAVPLDRGVVLLCDGALPNL